MEPLECNCDGTDGEYCECECGCECGDMGECECGFCAEIEDDQEDVS